MYGGFAYTGLISVIYQHELSIGVHMSPPSWTSVPPPTLSHPSRLFQSPSLSSLSHSANRLESFWEERPGLCLPQVLRKYLGAIKCGSFYVNTHQIWWNMNPRIWAMTFADLRLTKGESITIQNPQWWPYYRWGYIIARFFPSIFLDSLKVGLWFRGCHNLSAYAVVTLPVKVSL